MSSSKTTSAPARRRGAQKAPAGAPKPTVPKYNAERAIAQAQQGNVNVTPETAEDTAQATSIGLLLAGILLFAFLPKRKFTPPPR